MPTISTPCKMPYINDVWSTTTRTGITTYTKSSASLGICGSVETRVTNDNPNWRQEVSQSKDAGNDYLLRKCLSFRSPICKADTVWQQGLLGEVKQKCRAIYPGSNTVPVFGLEDSDLRNQALSRLKKKLRSEANMMNALVPAVELREIRGLGRSMADLTVKLMKTLINIKRTKGLSAARYAADAWLTYGFGISPTLNDAYNLGKVINERFTSTGRKRLVGGADGTMKLKPGPASFSLGTYAAGAVSFDLGAAIGYRFIAGTGADLDWQANYDLSDQLGFNFESLPSVLWELGPFTWVVDYFTNIGTILDDEISLPSGLTVYICENKKVLVTGYLKGKVYSNGVALSKLESSSVIDGSLSAVEFVRTTLPTLPHTGFRFKSLDEVGRNAFTKVSNLASILVKGIPKGDIHVFRTRVADNRRSRGRFDWPDIYARN